MKKAIFGNTLGNFMIPIDNITVHFGGFDSTFSHNGRRFQDRCTFHAILNENKYLTCPLCLKIELVGSPAGQFPKELTDMAIRSLVISNDDGHTYVNVVLNSTKEAKEISDYNYLNIAVEEKEGARYEEDIHYE